MGKLKLIKKTTPGNTHPPIVFVHGICHGAWCWENYIEYFCGKGYDCYAFSLRGHWGSYPAWNATISDYVSDLDQIISYIPNKKPVVVGHSMGGAIVQKYLELYPDKLSGIVLLASVPRNPIHPRKACGIGITTKILRLNIQLCKWE